MSLRVMTYNVLNGGTGRESLLLEVLRAAVPDIVVLQEVFDPGFVSRVADALEMQYFFARGNTKYHLALLSRWPIVASHSHHPFPPIQQTVLEATIEHPNGWRLNVFGLHPVPLPSALLELWRLWEIKVVLRRARLRAPSECLIVGDFNASAPGDSLRPDADSVSRASDLPARHSRNAQRRNGRLFSRIASQRRRVYLRPSKPDRSD
jgi:exodeoxyribonuclease III